MNLQRHVAEILQRQDAQCIRMPDDRRHRQRHLAEEVRDVDERQRREFDRAVVKREDDRRHGCRPGGRNHAEVPARGRVACQRNDTMIVREKAAVPHVLVDAAALRCGTVFDDIVVDHSGVTRRP